MVEGSKSVGELMGSKIPLEKVFYTKGFQLAQQNEIWEEVSAVEMRRISHLDTPSPVLALAQLPQPLSPNPLESILVLDNLQDPGNVGTLIRSAAWFGIKQIICTPETADPFGTKAVQSAMGNLFHVNIIYDDLQDALTPWKGHIYAALLQGELPQKPKAPYALIIGNEGNGIRTELLPPFHPICIPGHGHAESLNAGVAGSILLYHLQCVGK